MQLLEEKIFNNIQKYNLLNPEDKILIGVSGGVDSTVLLYVLSKLSTTKILPLHISVAHINHGIRKETAKRDEKFVQNFCKTLDIPCYVLKEDVPAYAKRNKMSEEEAGRAVRYAFFKQHSDESTKIVTAHHLNDNVETVLMRFLKGTGLSGLTGVKVKRENIVRPLLNITKKELIQYAEENEIDFVEDETNFANDYGRNKIRNILIPEIEKTYNESFVESTRKMIQYLDESNDFIQQTTRNAIKDICNLEKDCVYYNVEKFIALHPCIKNELLRITINEFTNYEVQNIRSWFYEDVEKLFTCKDGAMFQARGLLFYKKNNIVQLTLVINDELCVNLKENESVVVNDTQYTMSVENNANKNAICNIPILFAYDTENVKIRFCNEKDVIVFNDSNSMKSNKYFSMLGMSPAERRQQVVIAIENKIYWIQNRMKTKAEKTNIGYICIFENTHT